MAAERDHAHAIASRSDRRANRVVAPTTHLPFG